MFRLEKIDIEGAEKEVFADTSSWIEKVDAIIVELHVRMKPGCLRSFYNGSNGFGDEWKQGGMSTSLEVRVLNLPADLVI